MNPVLDESIANVATPAPSSAWTFRSYALLLGVLVLSTVVIVHGIRRGEFSYNVDEAQHAVTGLYAAALLQDHPSHPVEYTYEFYAQYPALGVIHWPPLFYFFEGLSFLLFGPTVVAARLTVLLFALLGLGSWFLMVRDLQDDWTAAFSTGLLALLPLVLLFEKVVMLEIPCLSLCIAASYCWTKYLLKEERSSLCWFVGFASAALLTKQNSVYLLLFCLASAVGWRRWRLLTKPPVLWSMLAVGLIAGPYYLLVARTHWQTTAANLTDQQVSGVSSLLFYWKCLPGQLGWTVLALAALGIATSLRWDRAANVVLMLAWIGSCYVTFTLIGLKDSRHSLYWLPPFTYFVGGLLLRMFQRPWLRLAAGGAALLLLGVSVALAWSFQRPYVSGFSAAAKTVTQVAPAGVILYDAELGGNFIFFVRADDPHRHFLVLRKALYAYRIDKRWGSEELIHDEKGVEDLIRRDGVRFVVVGERMRLNFEAQHALREAVQSPQFRLVGRFPVYSTEQAEVENLLVYENEAWTPPTEKFLRIRMLTLSNDIVVPFSRFEVVGAGPAALAGPR